MTASVERKTLKVSPEIHRAVHALAQQVGGRDGTADAAIAHLFSATRVHLSTTQQLRWTAYAEAAGMTLEQWITMRVEAAIAYGTDPGTMPVVLDYVRAIADHAGIQVTRRPAPRPEPSAWARQMEE